MAEIDWGTVATILATGLVTFLSSWGLFRLQEKRRKTEFKQILAIEVELNTVLCKNTIPHYRDLLNEGKADETVMQPLPFSKVVFEAFKDSLRFLDKDVLSETLRFYSRLDSAQSALEFTRHLQVAVPRSDSVTTALGWLDEAFVKGQELLKVLLPNSPTWGKGAIVQPGQLKSSSRGREQSHVEIPPT